MTDIIERLRFIMPSSLNDAIRTMEDAAQEIERLRSLCESISNDNERLIRSLPLPKAAERDETLKVLANLFSESVHETWTRGEIINIIEDVIKLGTVPVGRTLTP